MANDDYNVLFTFWLTSRAVHGLLDEALAPAGLTADEFGVYSVLTRSDAMTPTELARWMSAPATTVSSYVKRFEGRGHVTREPNPDDGRSYLIRLTAAGRKAHRAAGVRFLPALDAVVASLGARETTVKRGLESLKNAVDAAGEANA
jgi:DNA-binding MarR family transcriptional regulator